jgi:flagellar assembly protein FliH
MPSLEQTGQKETGEQDALSSIQRIEICERDGYEKGFAAGEKAGYAIGEQKAQLIGEKLEAILREVTVLKETLVRELEPQIIAMAFGIARRIILRELTVNPDEIVHITREALKKVGRTGRITITIHPSLYDLFAAHRPELLSIHPDIVFDTDPSVSPTGSVVVGQAEVLVTDIEEQLNNLFRGLESERGGN